MNANPHMSQASVPVAGEGGADVRAGSSSEDGASSASDSAEFDKRVESSSASDSIESDVFDRRAEPGAAGTQPGESSFDDSDSDSTSGSEYD